MTSTINPTISPPIAPAITGQALAAQYEGRRVEFIFHKDRHTSHVMTGIISTYMAKFYMIKFDNPNIYPHERVIPHADVIRFIDDEADYDLMAGYNYFLHCVVQSPAGTFSIISSMYLSQYLADGYTLWHTTPRHEDAVKTGTQLTARRAGIEVKALEYATEEKYQELADTGIIRRRWSVGMERRIELECEIWIDEDHRQARAALQGDLECLRWRMEADAVKRMNEANCQ